MLALVLASVLLAQATAPPVRAGDPVPDAAAAKPKHDTVKNAVGNVKATTGEPIPCLPGPCPGKAVSDPIPGVDTPSPGPHGDDKPKPK
jgi:hypothetical protein